MHSLYVHNNCFVIDKEECQTVQSLGLCQGHGQGLGSQNQGQGFEPQGQGQGLGF